MPHALSSATRLRPALLLGALLLGLCGCGAESPDTTPPAASARATERPADWPSDAARRLEADHAPTPYTADQIRAGCPSGLRSTYLMEGGGKKVIQVWAFDKADDTAVDFTMTQQDESGVIQGTPRKNRVEWTTLQRHADYPARYTEITEEEITVPAGTFLCMHYKVSQPDEGKISVGDFWFAYDLPGGPIRWIQSADGTTLVSMTLQERTIVDDSK